VYELEDHTSEVSAKKLEAGSQKGLRLGAKMYLSEDISVV